MNLLNGFVPTERIALVSLLNADNLVDADLNVLRNQDYSVTLAG